MIRVLTNYSLISFLSFTALLLSLALSLDVMAKDFGKFGSTEQIAEQDLLEYIKKKLLTIGEEPLAAHQEKIKNKIVENIKRPKRVKNISKVTKNSTRKFDPSFVVEADIRDANGALIHAKGKVINPLDYADFNEIWVFIDGDDEEQRDLASKIRKKQQNTKIILTGGAPGLQENGSWYFFDQFGEICKKMGITKVPAIVRQAKNQKLIEIVDVVPHDMLPHDVLSHEVLLP